MSYGDWGSGHAQVDLETEAKMQGADYYFAGGYSNRDYATLISTFSGLRESLVIICSKLNKDVDEESLPKNVTVLRDVPGEKFDAYVRQAKACILPLKHDTGASGISTLLRYKRNGKLCIVTNRSCAPDYVEDRVSGYVVRDMSRELPEVIAQIEANPELAVALGEAGRERYAARYCRTTVSLSLKEFLVGRA